MWDHIDGFGFRLAEDRQRIEVRVDRLSEVALFVIMKMMDLLTTLSYCLSRKSRDGMEYRYQLSWIVLRSWYLSIGRVTTDVGDSA